MNRINWQWFSFAELSLKQLYEVLKLRQEVFIVEQNCAYLDADELDLGSFHLLGFVDEQLAAYSRVLPAGMRFAHPSIGRIVVSPAFRKFGFGKELVQESLAHLEKHFGNQAVTIHAQAHLQKFYEALGFQRSSEEFLEDGIPHIEMLKSPN